MYRCRVHGFAVLLISLVLHAGASPAETPLCAVLLVEQGAGISPGQAILLSSRLADMVPETAPLRALRWNESNRALLAKGLAPSVLETDALNIIATGAALEVDYVVAGHLTRADERFVLITSLVDIAKRQIVRRVRSSYPGDWQTFLEAVPRKNLDALLDVVPDTVVERTAPRTMPARPPTPATPKATAGTPKAMPEPQPKAPTPATPRKPKPTRPIAKPTPKKVPTTVSVTPPLRDTMPDRPITGDTEAPPGQPRWEPMGRDLMDAVSGHLHVGTRLTRFFLHEDTRDSFLGTINELEALQTTSLFDLFADWYVDEYWGVGIDWSSVKARAKTTPNGYADGTFSIGGPVVTALGRYPNETRWTPYGGLGLAFYSGRYEAEAWWRLGYKSPVQWRDEGSPRTPNGGITQQMTLNNPLGFVMQVGCMVELRDQLHVDLLLRRVVVSADDRYKILLNGELHVDGKTTSIPLGHTSLGVGLRYAF